MSIVNIPPDAGPAIPRGIGIPGQCQEDDTVCFLRTRPAPDQQPADPTTTYTATYDAWNRLVKLVDGANTVQENEYDARTYRIVRKDYTDGSLDETRHFFYTDGWHLSSWITDMDGYFENIGECCPDNPT